MDATPGSNFRTFEELEVYQIARDFRKTMHAAARRLPKLETFGLGSQMRRAALCLTNNIAEGHGRYHYADQLKFLLQARGSLEELIDDLHVCLDEACLSPPEIEQHKQLAWRVHNLINGYGRYLRQRKSSEAGILKEIPSTTYLTNDEPDPFMDLPL